MKQSKQNQDLTVQNILKYSLELFDKKGYEKVSLDEIAKKSGVTRGAIYHNFSGKSEILKQIINKEDEKLTLKIEEKFSEDKNSIENFYDFYDIYFSELNKNSKLEKLLFFTTFSGEERRIIDKISIKQQKELENYFIYLLDMGMSEGKFSEEISSKKIAKVMYYNFVGLIYQYFNENLGKNNFYKQNLEIFFNGITK